MIWPYQPKMCDHCGRKLTLKPAYTIARTLTPAQVKALRNTFAHPDYSRLTIGGYAHYGLPGTRAALTARGLTVWNPGPIPPRVTPLGVAVLKCLGTAP